MKFIKGLCLIIVLGIGVQIFSYLVFGKRQLVNHVGDNYKSMILDYKENQFDEFFFINNLDVSNEQVKKYFKLFKNRTVEICPSLEACPNARRSDSFYNYFIEEEVEIPFLRSKIIESEMAFQFAATWKSRYVWVFYKWILIDKEMTGIS